MRPAFTQHTREADPCRTTNMVRIADQAMATQMVFKDFLASRDGVFFAHLAETKGIPGLLRTFDNEGRRFIIKLIGMRPHPTFVSFFKDKEIYQGTKYLQFFLSKRHI